MSISQMSPSQQESLLDGPALNPPPGTLSNFEHPPNRNALFQSVIIVCLCVSTFACIIRAYAKIIKARYAKYEDALGVLGFVAYVAYLGTSFWRMSYRGAFIHQWDIRLRDLPSLLLAGHLLTNFYSATMLMIKTAILVEWLRIFVPHGTRNGFYWACYVVMAFNILYYSAGIIAANLACIPYRGIWDITIPRRCINSKALILSGVVINLVSDLVILLLPQRVIWGLNMSVKKKVGVSVAFAVGVLGCVSAIARLVASVEYLRTDDSIYNASEVSLWAIAEMTCAFLIFCAPSFPRAFSGEGFLTRIAASVRSWGNLSRVLLNTNASGRDWSHGNLSTSPSSSTYRKIADNGIALKEMPSRSPMPAVGEGQASNGSSAGVLFTKQFTAEEEYSGVTTDIERRTHQKQHPWEDGRTT